MAEFPVGSSQLGREAGIFQPIVDSQTFDEVTSAVATALVGVNQAINDELRVVTLSTEFAPPLGGAKPVPAAPQILPMWAADP